MACIPFRQNSQPNGGKGCFVPQTGDGIKFPVTDKLFYALQIYLPFFFPFLNSLWGFVGGKITEFLETFYNFIHGALAFSLLRKDVLTSMVLFSVETVVWFDKLKYFYTRYKHEIKVIVDFLSSTSQ